MQTSHVTDALDMYFNLSLILTHRKAEENVKVDYKDHRRSTHFELKLSKIDLFYWFFENSLRIDAHHFLF